MAAATAIAVIGLVAGAAQMITEQQNKKMAQKRAAAARASMGGIKELNAFEDLQAADVSGIANQNIAQGESDAIDAAQGLGEAGAAQVTNILKVSTDARLKAQEKQAKEISDRDIREANAEAGIEQRKAGREATLVGMDLQQAQTDVAQAQSNQVAAAGGMFSSASALASGIDDGITKKKVTGSTGGPLDDYLKMSEELKIK